jgi:DNA-binding CsgD family transcriptional regulator
MVTPSAAMQTAEVRSDRLVRAEATVERACEEATSVVELCRGLRAAVGAVVPNDRWCGFALDPATMMPTNGYHAEGVDAAVLPRLLELEYGADEPNLVPHLARSSGGVATLGQATGGDLRSSARWREVIEPSGLAHELRAVFRDDRHVWGALILFRGPDVDDFTAEELSFVRRVTPTVASGFRRVLVRQHLDFGEDAREAGILLLSGEPLEVRTATGAARVWLDQLDDVGQGNELPTVVASAARRARRERGIVAARVRTRSGRWLTITAESTVAPTGGDQDVGIVIQPSRPAEIAHIVGAAHGLTARESEVVLHVAAGATNDEMARRLQLSHHTVGDHLKSIFAKVGVSTRGQLTSKLFFDHYLQRTIAARAAGTDGWFLPG